MPSSHPASSLYTPTHIEKAYAVYIYDSLFGDFPPDGSIHLEANAVLKILERSNVDGIILRTIWSVADPEGVRCLTDMSQFYVVLRLIALAQDGLLEKDLNRAFNRERSQTTPVTVFKKTLWMSSHYTDCPLPSFQGVAMPANAFLEVLSNRLRGVNAPPSSAPAPAPTPLSNRNQALVSAPCPVPTDKPKRPANTPLKLKEPSEELPPNQNPPVSMLINVQKTADHDSQIQSAIQQIENLGVDNPYPKVKSLKQLDPESFELLQEQAALQRAIIESKTAISLASDFVQPGNDYSAMCEEEALQKAIYESTHAATPQSSEQSVAVAHQQEEHKDWLRISSLQDSFRGMGNDVDSDEEYQKKKSKKGGVAYADYVASLDPSNVLQTEDSVRADRFQNSEELDMKPAAKPSPAKPPSKCHPKPTSMERLAPKELDDRVDEYPQAVQELVMNGFELQKAIQGYKMLGDNFDDIVLFLTSCTAIKELVINGFNIHKVVQAYDVIGDNMDDLLAYLMTNAT